MGSRLVTQMIVTGAQPLVKTIQKGKRLATVFGAAVGAALGACSSFLVTMPFVPFFMLLGAIAGATVAAVLFKRPTFSLGARPTDVEPFRPGAVLQAWRFDGSEFNNLTVLLERAIYVVRDRSTPWEEVIEKLSQGEDPDLPQGDLVRLDELTLIETRQANSAEMDLEYSFAGKTMRRGTVVRERDAFIAGLERCLGKPLPFQERPLAARRAMILPLVLSVVAALIFAGIAWLAVYWATDPPQDKGGKPDPAAQFLVSTGPEKILLAGACVVMLILAWLALRIKRPPKIYVIQVADPTKVTDDAVATS